MKTNLSKVYKPIFGIAALAAVVIDLVLGAVLVWSSSRVDAAREAYANLRAQAGAQQMLVTRLQETMATLPVTEGQMKLFLDNHVPSRREGFSRATHLIWSLKENAGVQLEGLSFKPEKRTQDEPLQPLAVEISLEGAFSNLINFAHSLETAGDFVVVRALNFNPGEGAKLSLHLSADFYITP
jgi:hypothetical protein